MRVSIEETPGLAEDEIIIRCAKADDSIRALYAKISGISGQTPRIALYKDQSEYFFSLENVLFFETEGDSVYAHTAADSFQTKSRLYELEKLLPAVFIRVSKSTILNAARVLAITRNLTSASLVEFEGTHKHVYVSRRYYAALKTALSERR